MPNARSGATLLLHQPRTMFVYAETLWYDSGKICNSYGFFMPLNFGTRWPHGLQSPASELLSSFEPHFGSLCTCCFCEFSFVFQVGAYLLCSASIAFSFRSIETRVIQSIPPQQWEESVRTDLFVSRCRHSRDAPFLRIAMALQPKNHCRSGIVSAAVALP